MTGSFALFRLIACVALISLTGCVSGSGGPCVPGAKGFLRSGCTDSGQVTAEASSNFDAAVADAEQKRIRAAMAWVASAPPDATSALMRWSELCDKRGGSFIERANERIDVGTTSILLPGTGWCLQSLSQSGSLQTVVLDGGWMNRQSLLNPDNRNTQVLAHTFWLFVGGATGSRELTTTDLDHLAQRMTRHPSESSSLTGTRSIGLQRSPDLDPASCLSFVGKEEFLPRGGSHRFLIQHWQRFCMDTLAHKRVAFAMLSEIRREDDPGATDRARRTREEAEQSMNSLTFRSPR